MVCGQVRRSEIKLPDINGLELTRLIKEKKSNIPIIAQTAYTLIGDCEKILAVGCDSYLSKPLPKEKLLKVLRGYLGS